MKKYLILFILFTIISSFSFSFAAPPVPGKKGYQGPREMYVSPRRVKALIDQGLSKREIYRTSPSTGTNKVIVIPVEFLVGGDDYTGEPSGSMTIYTSTSSIADLFEDVSEYYDENSYGLLTVDFDISPNIYPMPHPMDTYGANGTPQEEWDRYYALFQDATSDADIDVDFSQYESIIIFHAGWGEESDLLGNSPNDIWSAQARGFNETLDGKNFTDGIFVPEREDQDGTSLKPFGTICHEYGHQIGLPDLYDSVTGESGNVGYWCLMDSGNWLDDGNNPCHISDWCKIYLDWITPSSLNTDKINLPVSYYEGTDRQVYKINLTVADDPQSEYFLVSYHSKTGLDKEIKQEGLLIWYIDDSVGSVDDNDVNLNSYDHARVILVPADGSLSNGLGDSGDPWRSGMTFTSPESDAHNGATSGITIYDISGEGSSSMRISLTYAEMDDTVKIEKSFSYPNPAKGQIATIRFMSTKPVSERSIKIFTITGELVKEIPEDDIRISERPEDYEFVYESQWDMRNRGGEKVASGIYLYLIDAEGKKKIGKMAIIR